MADLLAFSLPSWHPFACDFGIGGYPVAIVALG
jgi:hypothetical protein